MLVFVMAASLVTSVSPSVANAAVVQDEFVASSTWQPTSMDFTSDGTALVSSKLARIERLNLDTGNISSYLFLTDKDIDGERGLLDILIDPTTDEVFLYRSRASSQLVVERFQYTGNASADLASLTTVWANPGPLHNQYGANHLGGGLAFGPNRDTIFISIGDGERAANSQELTNVFGKVLRINRDGSVPTSNPFYDGGGPNIDEIWSYGLRNPFRIWSGDDGQPWLGDVGGNDHSIAYEEIHRVEPGANYGWPMCQGPNSGPKNGPDCPAGITEPTFSWAHPPDPEISYFGSAVALGEILSNDAPAGLAGAMVYSDYANGRIEYLNFNGDGSVASSAILTETGRHPVWLGTAPNGYLYYIHFDFIEGQSHIRRLQITDVAQPGISIDAIYASTTSGPSALPVDFTADVSGDLDDFNNLTYIWDFGDGGSSNDVAPTHTYESNGSYQARLTITTDESVNFSEPIQITVGNTPVPQITSGTTLFNAGDTLSFQGTSTGGAGNVDLTWDLVFDHDDHAHPVVTASPGPSMQFQVPTTGHDWGGDTAFRVVLTATDESGLRASTEQIVEPRRVEVEVTSNLVGTRFSLDGEVRETPTTIETIVGFEHSLAVAYAPGQTFKRWSDGASANRSLTVPGANIALEIQFNDVVATATSVEGIIASTDYSQTSAETLRLYRAIFGREPDLSGAQYWILQNQQGLSVDDIAFYFADSPEFRLRFGQSLSDADFLNLVYQNTLNRGPDPVGAAYWLDVMDDGLAPHLVVRWFAGGQEFANNYPYGYAS